MVLGAAHWNRWRTTDASRLHVDDTAACGDLRRALLDFIADFANWDASTAPAFLDAARAITLAAHVSLGGEPGTRPTVADPFAGGGAIPLEALRLGCESFASDLNPLPVLMNRILAEFVPRFGGKLEDAVRRWGHWVQEEAERELAPLYPGSSTETPIAYLWARTVLCEGPGCGATVPLLSSTWLAKRPTRNLVLEPELDHRSKTLSFTVKRATSPKAGQGTMRSGSVTCPFCEYTTPNPRVRAQLAERHGGSADAMLLAVVVSRAGDAGRSYRKPNATDLEAFNVARKRWEKLLRSSEDGVHVIPNEVIPSERPSPNARGLSAVTRMGMRNFADLYTPRQAVTLATFARLIVEVGDRCRQEDPDIAPAVQACLGLALGRVSERCSSLARWDSSSKMETVAGTFGRQALPIVWDFAEAVPFRNVAGSWNGAVEWIGLVLDSVARASLGTGVVRQASATSLPAADDSLQMFFTDPPYYDSVPYADLSDYFYVWLRRALYKSFPDLFTPALTPKDEEAIWNPSRIYQPTGRPKDEAFYVAQMTKAFTEGRRATTPEGIGVVVFAHKSTAGWEAILSALLEAGWIVTASWPVDTEMAGRVNAMGTASLASSVHLVCRPREDGSGKLRDDDIGSWRAILAELPERIHEWMPRLAEEGVVGADAIFACLGPALELFSRHSRVEKASGERVTLKEYLEQVWAAVAREALSMMFEGADASGFEEDARLTAMWLWTLGAGGGAPEATADDEEGPVADDEESQRAKTKPLTGFVLEFDAARKIAQGLGAHLDKLAHVVEVKGDKARLLSVNERAKALFSKQTTSAAVSPDAKGKAKEKPAKKQLGLFAELEAAEKEGLLGEAGVPRVGETTLDRVHQAMILFGAGRSEALKRFVVDEGVGRDGRFWKLGQSLSALYPSSSDEKRWVDGVLARKKSLGF